MHGVLFFLIWGILSILMLCSFDMLSWSLGRRGWQRFLSTFLLFYAQMLLTEFTLGLTAILTRLTVLSLNLLVTGVTVLWVTRGWRSLWRLYVRSCVNSIRQVASELLQDPLCLALYAIGAGLILWIIFLGVLFPVTDIDGNAYHMTFVAQAIQSHSIYDAPTSITWLTGYPKGAELMQLWSVIITHRDLVADLTQVPFIFLGVVSLYALSRRLGVRKRDARFASLLFLFIPIVINQAKTTYIDIILCSLFFAALAIATKRRPSRLDLILEGIVFSLILSVKSTGLLFVCACLPFLVANILKLEQGRVLPAYKEYTKKLSLVAAPVAFGVYWYIKDWVLYHSPLYPFGLKVAGLQLFPGRSFQEFIAGAFSNASILPSGKLSRVWFVWTEQKDWFGCMYNYDATFSGLGPMWFVLLLPSIIVGIVIGLYRRNYLLLAVLLVVGAVFLAYPADFYTRYTMFIVLIGIICFGFASSVLGEPVRTFMRLFALLLALNVIGTTFTLCNFTPAVIRDQIVSFRQGNPRAGVAYTNAVGNAYRFIQGNVRSGEVVAYDSSPYLIYPLWRSDYKNKVEYIPGTQRSTWLHDVRQAQVKYIFTNLASKEHKWLQGAPGFTSVYKDGMYEIYEAQ